MTARVNVGKSQINSMTGFGKASEKSPFGKITVEIKTLNHKSLSIACNPFNGFFLLDEKVKEIIDKKLFRGKVFVKITVDGGERIAKAQTITVNENMLKQYVKKIKAAQKKLKIPGDLEIGKLINFPGIIETTAEKKEDKTWTHIKKTLEEAVKALVRYRRAEGNRLAKDFNTRLCRIEKNTQIIKKYGKESVKEYRKKLINTIKDVSKNITPDRNRLETEVAAFAKNCDVAEEITRLTGHVSAYREAMRKVKTDAGKKMDFIAQEMQREANTIGAKSSDFRIAKAVIDIKSEIDKMREQIRNVE
ncbi:MAG: YicC/YloC family endoribonuclease [Candidatus Omnitrophota bacterium]|nr:YicC family protein [Candidatus Omnitrophota bacterium]MBU1894432.1 YicC family protein [Candidatus Omnitrophota bacterium]